jgi:NOL1/NOP2/fmu family ribosome biogenesis protein
MTTPHVDLPYQTAIAYLRREAIVLPPDTPRGLVSVTFRGHHLGYVKNIGSRANNLYPKEWAIKSTHIPNEYTPVIL